MKNTNSFLILSSVICLLLFSACSKNTNNSLAAFQPEISNVPDNFQLQASNVKQVTTNIDYSWTNNSTIATIDKSGVLTAGEARLLIFDKNNSNVYTGDLKTTGNGVTTTGVAGIWKIRLELTNYDGTLNFRVQKK